MTPKVKLKKRSLWRFAGLFLGLALLVGAVQWAQGWRLQTEQERDLSTQNVMRKAPSFALPDVQGKIHRLEDFEGKAVILHFWASWCPPCLAEIPQWVELGALLKDKPVQMIAISLDTQWEDALKILPSEKLGPNILSLLDTTGMSPEAYGSFQFPETYLLSPSLRIVTKLVGPQDWGSADFQKMMDKILSLRGQNSHLFKSFANQGFEREFFFLFPDV